MASSSDDYNLIVNMCAAAAAGDRFIIIQGAGSAECFSLDEAGSMVVHGDFKRAGTVVIDVNSSAAYIAQFITSGGAIQAGITKDGVGDFGDISTYFGSGILDWNSSWTSDPNTVPMAGTMGDTILWSDGTHFHIAVNTDGTSTGWKSAVFA